MARTIRHINKQKTRGRMHSSIIMSLLLLQIFLSKTHIKTMPNQIKKLMASACSSSSSSKLVKSIKACHHAEVFSQALIAAL